MSGVPTPGPRSCVTLSELPCLACAAWTTCCFGRGDSAAAVGVTGQNFIYETPPTLSLEYIARRARTHTHSPPLYSPPSSPAAFLLRLYIAIIRGTHFNLYSTLAWQPPFVLGQQAQTTPLYSEDVLLYPPFGTGSPSNATTPTAQHPHTYIYALPSLP